MAPKIKIFISTHRSDVYFPENRFLYPIQVGTTEKKCFPGILHDNQGDNIASKNGSYCELTAQYYAYKNMKADYYGFFHYRRYFNFSDVKYPVVIKPFVCGDVLATRNDEETLKKYLIDEEHIAATLKGYDYIAPVKTDASDGRTIYEQYHDSVDHYISDLDSVVDIIKTDYPHIYPYAEKYLSSTKSYLCNMFIMKKELFMEYSSFLFDVLEKHETLCDISKYSPVAARVSGYLGERLCGIFLTYLEDSGYKGKELQRVFFQEFRTDEAIEADKQTAGGSGASKSSGASKKTPAVYGKAKSSYFDENYGNWFLKNRVTSKELSNQSLKSFSLTPKYSIIVPLYNTPIDFFDDMLESVLGQSYKNFELILVNASKDNEKLLSHANEVSSKSSRVKQIVLDGNYGITENTNYGIKEATGDFLCFLDHDDVLESDVLYEYTKALNENPEIDMFYCDEDKLRGTRYCEPFFKPDWNIDYLNAVNYVCHFLTVRKSILDSMELPTSDYDGSQDYHMTYRIGEKARCIHHVPKILYHWRVHADSTASSATQKDYTLDSSILSIEEHLKRTGVEGSVVESDICPRRFKIKYKLPTELISVVIRYNGDIDKLNRCINSIKRTAGDANYEIVIVGPALSDIAFYIERLKKLGISVTTVSAENERDYNDFFGVRFNESNSAYLFFADADIEFTAGSWTELVATCIRDDVIAAGPRFLLNKTDIDNVGLSLSNKGIVKNGLGLNKIDGASLDRFLCSMDVDCISGKCIAIRRDMWNKSSGFDTKFTSLYQGVDFCLTMKKENPSGNVVVDPTVSVVINGASSDKSATGSSASEDALLMSKWNFISKINASTYNPNLNMYKTYDVINYSDVEVLAGKAKRKTKGALRKAYHKLK